MVVSVDPTRRIQDHDELEEGKDVVVIYQHSWQSDTDRCHGTITGVLGPEHDRSFVIEPTDAELSSITLHSRASSGGTVDGESVHDIATVEPERG